MNSTPLLSGQAIVDADKSLESEHACYKTALFSRSRFHLVLAITLLLSLACFAQAGYMFAKAQLAQWLLQTSWQQSLSTGSVQKPWPWADTWPVARLRWQNKEGLKEDLIVLQGLHGESLAFGPGMEGSNQQGWLIAAHRDSHFRFLKELQIGERIQLQDKSGAWQHWQVLKQSVHHIERDQLWLQPGELILLSCYPFDQAEAGGPLRYVLRLQPVGDGENGAWVSALAQPQNDGGFATAEAAHVWSL